MDQAVPIGSNRFLENKYMRIWEDDGILVCKFADGLEMDLDIAKACVGLRLEYSRGESFALLVNMKGMKSATKEAREYMSNEGSRQVLAGALLISSPVSRVLGNVFLSLNRPQVATRLFTTERSAVEWLKKFINH